jgi:hypothetical protein
VKGEISLFTLHNSNFLLVGWCSRKEPPTDADPRRLEEVKIQGMGGRNAMLKAVGRRRRGGGSKPREMR